MCETTEILVLEHEADLLNGHKLFLVWGCKVITLHSFACIHTPERVSEIY